MDLIDAFPAFSSNEGGDSLPGISQAAFNVVLIVADLPLAHLIIRIFLKGLALLEGLHGVFVVGAVTILMEVPILLPWNLACKCEGVDLIRNSPVLAAIFHLHDQLVLLLPISLVFIIAPSWRLLIAKLAARHVSVYVQSGVPLEDFVLQEIDSTISLSHCVDRRLLGRGKGSGLGWRRAFISWQVSIRVNHNRHLC